MQQKGASHSFSNLYPLLQLEEESTVDEVILQTRKRVKRTGILVPISRDSIRQY
jgi:hypothetical protein